MSDYQFLTPEMQAEIVAELQVVRPEPTNVLLEREKAHYRAVIEAKLGLHDMPDPYEPVDVSKETGEQAKLDEEADKLPPPPIVAEVADVKVVG